ncbi:MAG: hypothetical protein DI538_17330 [Azospira oryzae]|nr:MAG: hypothetical protein DI538_17330 [Azospira oryzae]
MENLKKEWLTEGLIDFEYKKYMLLAYLQNTKASFKRIELYPFLSDLVDHYQRLLTVKESKTIINASFPKELTEEGLKKLKLTYRKVVEDDVVMREIESIIEFALPQFKTSLDEGAFIYDYVESNCELSPVGLTSLYTNEGYLFIAPPPQRETNVYRYQVSIFGNANDPIRTLNTEYVMTTERSLANSYENIKLQLIKQNALLPNPSVYLITSRMNFPYTSTLMPIAKRLLIKHISKPV